MTYDCLPSRSRISRCVTRVAELASSKTDALTASAAAAPNAAAIAPVN